MKVFTEYAGAGSFAGAHQPGDTRDLVLFDVLAGTAGLVGPFDFVRDFGHLRIPRVVFQGRFSGKLTEDVRRGKYEVREGVVIKGGTGGDDLWMCKVKTLAYLESHPEPTAFVDTARLLIFLKGNNAHDYKFSSAVLEDYQNVSPAWRSRYLASSVFNLRGSAGPDNSLVNRTRAALG